MTPTRAVQFNMSFGVGFAPQKLLFRYILKGYYYANF
jgi:hypothetical protein